MSDDAAGFGLIARQQKQMLTELGSMRDDTGVMMAVFMRLDGTVAGLVNEVREIHSQHSRLQSRVKLPEMAGDVA